MNTTKNIDIQIKTVNDNLQAFNEYLQSIQAAQQKQAYGFADILNKEFLGIQAEFTKAVNKLLIEHRQVQTQLSQVNQELEYARQKNALFLEQARQEAEQIKANAQIQASKLVTESREESAKFLKDAGDEVLNMGKQHLYSVQQTATKSLQDAQTLERIINRLISDTDFETILRQTRLIQEKITQAANESKELQSKNTQLDQLQKNTEAMLKLQDTLESRANQVSRLVDKLGPIAVRLENSLQDAQKITASEKEFITNELSLLRVFQQKLDNTIVAINSTIQELNRASASKFSIAEKDLQTIIRDLQSNKRPTPTPTVLQDRLGIPENSNKKQRTETERVTVKEKDQPKLIIPIQYPQVQKQQQQQYQQKPQQYPYQYFQNPLQQNEDGTTEEYKKDRIQIDNYVRENRSSQLGLGKHEASQKDDQNKESFENNEVGLQQLDTQENNTEIDEESVPEVTAEQKRGTGIGTVLALGAGLLILTVLLVKYRNRSRSRSRSDSDQ